MLQQLRSFDPDRADMEEMIALLGFANTMMATFLSKNLAVPEWLTEKTASIEQTISTLRRDALARELKLARAKLDKLKTAEEQRMDTRSRIEELEKMLG